MTSNNLPWPDLQFSKSPPHDTGCVFGGSSGQRDRIEFHQSSADDSLRNLDVNSQAGFRLIFQINNGLTGRIKNTADGLNFDFLFGIGNARRTAPLKISAHVIREDVIQVLGRSLPEVFFCDRRRSFQSGPILRC